MTNAYAGTAGPGGGAPYPGRNPPLWHKFVNLCYSGGDLLFKSDVLPDKGGEGTGVIVSRRGNMAFILTANHVVEKDRKVNVETFTDASYPKPSGSFDAEVWTRWRDEPSFTPPGGESLVELGRRVRDACESLAAHAAESDVVVVTHVSPIKAAVAWALGAGDDLGWRLRVDVASITRVATSGDRPVLHAFNEAVPLEG